MLIVLPSSNQHLVTLLKLKPNRQILKFLYEWWDNLCQFYYFWVLNLSLTSNLIKKDTTDQRNHLQIHLMQLHWWLTAQVANEVCKLASVSKSKYQLSPLSARQIPIAGSTSAMVAGNEQDLHHLNVHHISGVQIIRLTLWGLYNMLLHQ